MPSAPSDRRSAHDKALAVLLTLATIAMIAVVLPFYGALMWAAILALLFKPLQRRLTQRLNGRAGWAALLTLALMTLIVVLPLLAMASSLAQEGARLADGVQSGRIDVLAMGQRVFAALPAPLVDLLEHFGLGDAAAMRRRIAASAGRAGQFFGAHVLNIGQTTLDFVVQLFVAMYVAFFMLRDGSALSRELWAAIPLHDDDKRELRERVATVVRATVKGNVVVAAIQGALGGLALWALGIPGALLAGTVMALLSLLPAVGAALVWAPVAVYLLAIGEVWQGVGLALFGIFVIGLVDNVLRPILVGRDTRLPDWLVLVTTIGGIALIGLNGFVIGPLVASLFIAAWSLFGRRRGAANSVSESGQP